MKEKITFEGKWWIEGENKEPQIGTLTYDPSRGLELVVKTVERIDSDKKYNILPPVPDTIVGQVQYDRFFSLYECSTRYRSQRELYTYTISANFGTHGYKALTLDQVFCTHIRAEFSLLHGWLGLVNYEPNNSDTQFGVIQAPHEPIEFTINSEAKLVFHPDIDQAHDNSGITFYDGHFLEFKFSKELPAREALNKYVDKFCRFLTMMTGEPTFIDNTYFFGYDKETPKRMILYRRNLGVESANREKSNWAMSASYQDISKNISNIVKLWYELEKSLGDALDIYFATIFSPSEYKNQTFLSLAQVLEAYHRKNSEKFDGQIELKSAFRARKKRIFENVSTEEKEWLKEKLAYANEKSLAQRLEEIIEPHKTEVGKFIKDIDKFSQSILHTRNYYTHYEINKKKKEYVITDVRLVELNKKMRAILEICIFSDLGIPRKSIEKIIDNINSMGFSKF